jgi:hypothetical protein
MQTRISQPKLTASRLALRPSRTTGDFCGYQSLDWRNLQGSHTSDLQGSHAKFYLPEVKT